MGGIFLGGQQKSPCTSVRGTKQPRVVAGGLETAEL